MAWTYPHTFHDGTGETASGAQVSENFTKAKEQIEALEAKLTALETLAAGIKWSGPIAAPGEGGESGVLSATHAAVVTVVAEGASNVAMIVEIWVEGKQVAWETVPASTAGAAAITLTFVVPKGAQFKVQQRFGVLTLRYNWIPIGLT